MLRAAARGAHPRDAWWQEETGRLAHAGVTAITLPLPRMQEGALALSDAEFQKEFAAPKPKKSDAIIFSCRSGRRCARASQRVALTRGFVRSALACSIAMALGYDKVYNYAGSANDWFSS